LIPEFPGPTGPALWVGNNFLIQFAGTVTNPQQIGSATVVAGSYQFYVQNNSAVDIIIYDTVTCVPPK
jgi:hypothetical protein